jgi:hypothetical protein
MASRDYFEEANQRARDLPNPYGNTVWKGPTELRTGRGFGRKLARGRLSVIGVY